VAALLALLSSLLWGTADFLGGTAARQRAALAVVGGSQAIGLLGVGVAVLASGSWHDHGGYLIPGLVAGAVSVVALSAFYAGLAVGRMGVVAAVSALGLLVPVAVGIVRGDRPSALQVAGMAIAATGAVCASGPELRAGVGRRPLLLALLAAAGFGTVLVALAEGGDDSVPMTLLVMRATTVGLLLAVALIRRTRGGLVRADLAVLAAIGMTDVVANGCYAAATTSGLLSVVAVLGSLYPAVTVVLARLVHHERLRRVQDVGIAAALIGVALIASGGGA
jgi:drug/metabolite transporter (DMT)-like permease